MRLHSDFFRIPRDERSAIFEGDIDSVGGRATDLEQLAYSVEDRVKEFYEINWAPQEIVSALADFKHQCRQAQTTFIEIVRILIREGEEDAQRQRDRSQDGNDRRSEG